MTEAKPAIIEVLQQVGAPKEWNKAMMRVEKTVYSARQALMRGMNFQEALGYGDRISEDLTFLGDPASSYGVKRENKAYWDEYFKLRFNTSPGDNNFDFGDMIA